MIPHTLIQKFTAMLVFLVIGINAFATHIVGGDFSYHHISGDNYQIKLKMYRDCTSNTQYTSFVNVGIYNKETNALVKTVQIPRISIKPIEYNTSCINPTLRCVEVGLYITNFTMPQSEFNNTAGYYVQWEGCCRNNIIKNIVDPGVESMAFYMEFPSPYPNAGAQNINSSPEFLRDPLSYLCVGEPFKYNFHIFDPDGDEIRMKIGVPMAGGGYTGPGGASKTATGPAPYSDIVWATGYSITNVMDGSPDLSVDNDSATIYIVPTQIGVYVISVIAEEYRNGIKIGEVRRELQLEVLICPPRFKPIITTNIAGGTNTVYANVGQQVCFDLNAIDQNASELLKFRIDTGGMYKLFATGSASLDPSDVSAPLVIDAKFCWTPSCPLDTGAGAYLDFIAFDNSCPFSQDDTVRVKFIVNSNVNIAPTLKTNLVNNTINIHRNENACFQIQGSDLNAFDEISIEPIIKNYDVFANGATLSPTILVGNGALSAEICWTPDCSLVMDSPIYLQFIIKDNACPSEAFDTIDVTINVLPLINAKPSIIAEGLNVGINNVVEMIFEEVNCFSIFADDVDVDDIDIYYQNNTFNFEDHGATFVNLEDQQNSIRSQFCWTPSCADFNENDSPYLDFLVRDNKCENEKFDTIRVFFKFNFPANAKPEIVKPDSIKYVLSAGYSKQIDVSATDADIADLLLLSASPLYSSSVPLRIDMNTVQGNGSIQTFMNVFPDCGIEGNVDYPVELTLLSSKYCDRFDTIKRVVNFQVIPLLDIEKPLVPDVFSPNGDGINDEYKIYLASRTICPDDFEFLIFDRWGQKMLETQDPEFTWQGEGCTAGAYVYYLRVGETKYTGFIALVK